MSGPKDERLTPLSSAQHDLLTYIEQRFLEDGGVPTEDAVVEAGICNGDFYRKCLRTAKFREALLVRGIAMRAPDKPGTGVLTETQLFVANTMLDRRDNRSDKKKLTELGISTQQYQAWLRDPVYQQYIRSRAESYLHDHLHESHLALVERVRSGDINAIKYFNEITGRYVPGANDKADVQSVLLSVLEIIQRHVKDPNALSEIATDLLTLGSENGARGITPGSRVIPGVTVTQIALPSSADTIDSEVVGY